jgi:hypothetical protein
MSIEKPNSAADVLLPILNNPGPVLRHAEPHPGGKAGKHTARRLAAVAILIAGAVTPAWLATMPARTPQTRDIHIEAYRYGFNPARIHVNRGDRLRLTFSTRDTGQSFFLQDYDIHVSITPGSRLVSVQRLSRPDDPPLRTETVELVAGLPGWRGMLVSKSQFRNHTYNGPLHGTERGDLIVAPNLLLFAGLGLLAAIPFAGLLLAGRGQPRERGRVWNLFAVFPWLRRAARSPWFQLNLTLPMLAVFWLVILAGLAGTKVSGRNAAPMIIWVLWLSGLVIVLVPIGGRSWCTVCPLPIMGEWMQRSWLSRMRQRLVWPRWLSNAWPRVLLFLLLGTFSTTLVAVPAATSWMLIGLIVMSIAASFFPEQRLFCRHLCPINSFISLYSTTGRVMVRPISKQACDTVCTERFCLTGSAKGWGCPYGLCVSDIDRNNDCGVCLECVKTCAYNNVGLFWRNQDFDRQIASYGEAWQAMVMFFLACLYSFINLGAWDKIRDWIDIVDKGRWDTFAIYAAAVWVTCLGVLPVAWYLLTRIGLGIAKLTTAPKVQFRITSAALIPIGLGCWIAFALATLLSMMTFSLQSLSDPFNWGWDLLGTAGSRWHILWAPGIPWLQVTCVLIGAAYSLQTLYRYWGTGRSTRRAILGTAPLGAFLWSAAAGMIYFFAA